jgi:hypothetical protein
MVQCSKHVIPPAIEGPLTDQPAHDLEVGLDVQDRRVLTGWRLGTILTPKSEMVDPH